MNDNKKSKYSVIRSFMKPFWIVSENMQTFLVQGACFSAFVVVLSYLFGQKYLCFFNQDVAQNMYCPAMYHMYLPYLLAKFLLIAIFMNLWYDKTFKNITINRQYIKDHCKKFFATFGVLLIGLMINFLPIVSYLLLFFRNPNPVWQIEQLYFTVVAVGFLVPFLLMRFYGLFAQFLAGNNWKEFKKSWQRTSGYTMKIVLSCALLSLMCLLVILSVTGLLRSGSVLPAELYNIVAEFAFAFTSYFNIVLFIDFFEVQKEYFLE